MRAHGIVQAMRLPPSTTTFRKKRDGSFAVFSEHGECRSEGAARTVMSQTICRMFPPPTAYPATMAITGLGRRRICTCVYACQPILSSKCRSNVLLHAQGIPAPCKGNRERPKWVTCKSRTLRRGILSGPT